MSSIRLIVTLSVLTACQSGGTPGSPTNAGGAKDSHSTGGGGGNVGEIESGGSGSGTDASGGASTPAVTGGTKGTPANQDAGSGMGGMVRDAGVNNVGGQSWVGVIACDRGPNFWPNGAKAAVSLTYDDAMPSQVRYAVPALDAKGFKGTFFLTTGKSLWNASLWRPLAASGHELASHSVTHNDKITRAAMEAEILQTIATIKSLGVSQDKFTFAYPNGALSGTDGSFSSIVLKHTVAARGLDGSSTMRNGNTNWDRVSSRLLFENDNLASLLQNGINAGSWTTFVVHGIEDDAYLNIPKTKHDELVNRLSDNRSSIWVAPFITVADYLQRCR
jgi:peptidoglycan/xylan/chitin deacetylase (PgdA/CDA1 family)